MSLMGNVKLYLADNPAIPLGNISWYRGDSFPIPLLVKQDGQAIDLTGCTFLLTASSVGNPPGAAQQAFQISGVIVAGQDITPGRLYFLPSAVDTDLESRKYFYDIQMVNSDGHVRTVAKFNWTILQDITKRTGVGGWDTVPAWDDVPDWDTVPGQ